MIDSRVIGIAVAEDETSDWAQALEAAAARSGRPLSVAPDARPDEVDYLVYNIDSGLRDFTPYTRLRAILNTWAGVEKVISQLSWPDHVAFVRMVEHGMNASIAEYFTGHALRYHLDIDRALGQSAAAIWEKWEPPLAEDRSVGVLGLGELGARVAAMLAGIGFRVAGWSRSPKDLPGIECHHGAEGLHEVLSRAEILAVMLPVTAETRDLLNAERLALLPRGACIINAGRGELIDDDALLAALAAGQLRHATLDVFRTEPLASDHPFWRHPQITVTPHIAASTRTKTATGSILAQIGRDMDGLAVQNVVDPARGY